MAKIIPFKLNRNKKAKPVQKTRGQAPSVAERIAELCDRLEKIKQFAEQHAAQEQLPSLMAFEADLKEELDPERTLFVVCSKTFTTQETMVNARAARDWIVDKLDAVAVQYHFVAASTNHEALDDFGIRSDYRFGFWDWVGGRYSLWSAVGLSLALVVGMDTFRRLLNGGRVMDLHFRNAPLDENMPVLLALLPPRSLF